MNVECSHCSALHRNDERRVLKSFVVGGAKSGICYDHGKVQLETLDDPPEPVRRLTTTLWGILSHMRPLVHPRASICATSSIAVGGVASNINHDDATFELRRAEQHISSTRSPSELFVARYLIQDIARKP
ncbi:hypothetical protein C8R46DRAFT_1210154 [Mycena filopes]|nr:hypothetical protein C8R46DRAFT_1210154 [Mycena filopes]